MFPLGGAGNLGDLSVGGGRGTANCSNYSKLRRLLFGEVRYNSLMKTFFTGLDSIQRCCRPIRRHTTVPLTGYPQEAEVPKAANTRKNRENVNEQLFVATERNAKLRYEGYKKFSEM